MSVRSIRACRNQKSHLEIAFAELAKNEKIRKPYLGMEFTIRHPTKSVVRLAMKVLLQLLDSGSF
eukprot:snap_masked-scaffold_16-processed-gene-4.11-mRNA-1 protein AED:1.00 eAED:1.00 QI:0/-1/0/0/-1/1/1/0/64